MVFVVAQTLCSDLFEAGAIEPGDIHNIEWCYDNLEEAKSLFEEIKLCFQEFRRVLPRQYLSTIIFSFDDDYELLDFMVSDSLGRPCFFPGCLDYLILEMEPLEEDDK